MILNLDRHNKQSLAAIDSDKCTLTYGELLSFADTIKQYIPQRALLFVLTQNNVGGIAWIIGSIASKNVPLILNARTERSLFDNLFTIYQPEYLIVPLEKQEEFNYTIIKEAYGYALLKVKGEPCVLNENLSHLLPTSGSTGSPKLVRHKYENIDASALNISTFFELQSKDRPLLVLPLYYTMGLSVVFSHLYVGATVLITNLNMTDRNFWQFIKDNQATSFTGVPFSFEVLNIMRFFRMDLPYLTLLTQGGGKMQRELNQKFVQYCKQTNKKWIATYGQSECTARMAYLPSQYAEKKLGSIGIAVPNGELSLIDEKNNVITSPNVEGELCYKGRNVTMGYAIERKDLAKGDERNGFIKTGDLAYRDEDGFYFITGRKGRFVKLFGLRIGLDECEEIIKSSLGIDCACVGNEDKIFVYITQAEYKDKVREDLADKLKIVANAVDVRVIHRIPKNEAGKILYGKL